MDEFRRQLSTSVPLLASVIIELDGNLAEIEHQIELCKDRTASGKLLLRSDRVIRDYLVRSPFKFDQYASGLSVTIRAADEISTEFAEFESDILALKQFKFAEISQMVDERMAIHQATIDRLPALLEEVGQRLKTHAEATDRCSAKRDRVERGIPLLEVELNERRQLCSDLTEKYAQLNAVQAEQKRTLDEERTERTRKEAAYQRSQQKHLVLKAELKTQNGKLTEAKCQIRRSIFEYLNKVQHLASLTEAKNRKMNEFKSLFQKYNKEGLARLNERCASLKVDLERLRSHSSKSLIDQDRLADFGFIERLRSKKSEKKQVILHDLIDKLARLQSLHDRLIGAYETDGGGEKVADRTDPQTDPKSDNQTEHTTQLASSSLAKAKDSAKKKCDQPVVSLKSKLRTYNRRK